MTAPAYTICDTDLCRVMTSLRITLPAVLRGARSRAGLALHAAALGHGRTRAFPPHDVRGVLSVRLRQQNATQKQARYSFGVHRIGPC